MFVDHFLSHLTLLLFAGLLVWAAVTDVRRFLIPNRISLAIVVLYPAYVLMSDQPVDWLGAVVVFTLVFAAGAVLFALGITGGGDVKILAATSLWAGPEIVVEFLLVTAIVGGMLGFGKLAMVKYARMRLARCGEPEDAQQSISEQYLPYGVAIVAGGLFVVWRLIGGGGLPI